MFDDVPRRRTFLRTVAATGGMGVVGTGSVSANARLTVDTSDPDSFDSIQAAVDAASDGTTIKVTSDRYNETVFLPGSKSLTLRGDPGDDAPGVGPDAPVIEGDGVAHESGIVLRDGPETPETVIEGIELRSFGRNAEPGERGFGIKGLSRSNVTIQNCYVHNIAGNGIMTHNRGEFDLTNWTVRNCRVDACANVGIHLNNLSESTVVDNLVSATEPVTDFEGVWWEQGRPEGNPKEGIHIANRAAEDNHAVARDITVANNRLEAAFDSAAITVRTASKDDGSGVMRNLKLRENEITFPDSDEEIAPGEQVGIKIATNPWPDGQPAGIRNVVVESNTVKNGGHAFKIFSQTKHSVADGHTQGIANVRIHGNTAEGASVGVIPVTTKQGEIWNVEVTENTMTDLKLPVTLWSRGYQIRDLNCSDNKNAVTENADELVYGLQVVSFGTDGVKDVTFSGTEFTDYTAGVAFFGLESDAIQDVTVSACTLRDNKYGVEVSNSAEGGARNLVVEESTITENEVGVITDTESSGDSIEIHYSDITDNEEYGIENYTGKGMISAHCNFWGHATGPDHAENKKGKGDSVDDGVGYDPWLPQSHEKVPKKACKIGNPSKGNDGNGRSGKKDEDHPGKRNH